MEYGFQKKNLSTHPTPFSLQNANQTHYLPPWFLSDEDAHGISITATLDEFLFYSIFHFSPFWMAGP